MMHWIFLAWDYLSSAAQWSLPRDWWKGSTIPALLFQHLAYSALAVSAAALIAIPLGLWVGHTGKGSLFIVGSVNTLRSIPTLGVLLLALLLTGIGLIPPVLALTFLAASPILAGTYAGITHVDHSVVDAAHAVGMSRLGVLLRVQFPLALPLIIEGIRGATLQVVATAAVAAYAGLGGLGFILIQGVQLRHYDEVLAGAFLVTIVTLLLDALWARITRLAATSLHPSI